MIKNYISKIIDTNDSSSAKRLITLIISFHFIIASFAILVICFYVIFHIPKGMVDEKLLNLLREILQYDFYIIISGLGFVTIEGATSIIVEGTKAKYLNSSTTETTTSSPEEGVVNKTN